MSSADLEHVRTGFQNVFLKAMQELDVSKADKVELEDKIQNLEEKVKEMNGGDVEEDILTSIVGSWTIVSSTGMKAYLDKWGTRKEIDAIFQVGTQNFEIEGDVVTMYNTIGITEHWRGKYTIGVKKNGARVLVDDNKLVSIYFADESREEYMRLERFVKNGQLHVVTKRFGLNCTRVYERVGKKDSRTAELEAELKKLNLELTAETELLRKEREETEKCREMFQKKASKEWSLLEEIIKLQMANEEMKKENEELKKEKAAPLPIKTAILGTWQLVKSSASEAKSQTTIFLMEDGHITESNAMGDKRTAWVLNDGLHSHNYSLFAHSVIDNEKFVTDFYTKWGGAFEFSFERRIVNGMLEILKVSRAGKQETLVYKRVD